MLLVVTVGVVLSLTGCVPSRPSASDWDTTARHSLEDTVSQTQTMRLVLVGLEDDTILQTSARSMAVQVEEAVSKAAESVTTLQPPAARREQAARVTQLLSDAADLTRQCRIALTDRGTAGYRDLVDQLDALTRDLEDQAGRLG